MKIFRQPCTFRPGRLPVLGWVFAWILLAFQGIAGAAAPPCSADDAGSSIASAMPEMTDPSAMQMSAHLDSSTATGCDHCRSHSQGHGCSGLHSCNAQLAAARPLSLSIRVMQIQVAPLPAALPRLATLAFDPPLRPPPA